MSANDELQAHTCEKMLEFCGDVANNVAQTKVQDLTEQWEKGELEVDQYYYVKYADGSVEIQLYVGGFLMRTDNKVVEVLVPVPSYEEWKTVFNCANKYEVEYIECANDYENVKKENQQLKELLKECREWIEFLDVKMKAEKSPKNSMCFEVMLLKIDNAIGEKK